MTEPSADPPTIGPFDVLYKLGEGAMGVVYAGHDRQLDRKVALKLVRRQLLENVAVRARMVREAQAMARLSSPYVVQVYQVGEHRDGIYVAMEYVDGETLTHWLRSGGRSWENILAALCDAGRGLAAAHAAGLIHRDFKPDNVLVDADGRARVLDFGLVYRESDVPGEEELTTAQTPLSAPEVENVERTDLHWSVRLTRMGNVLGTPAYMSPEQHFGWPAGAASDQFSFCITLYEALYGARPFVGDTWAAIRRAVQEGTVPAPPLESRVPRRLFKVLARGLAKTPEERWPSMDVLLEALERDPWGTRTRIAAIIGLVGAASSVSYAAAVSRSGEQSCEAGPELLAGAWDPDRQADISRAFAATRLPYSKDTWVRVKTRLDEYSQAWIGAWGDACREHASGGQVRRWLDLKLACLGRRKAHMTALVNVLAKADPAIVENAILAVAALPSIASCDDSDVLLTAAVPPDDPTLATQVDELRGQLARGAALETTGKFAEGLEEVAGVRVAAEGLGFAPLIAEAALHEGRVLMNLGRAQVAEKALVRAVQIGITHDMHAVAAEAAAIRIYVIGETLGRRAEALNSAPFAEALVERARDSRLDALLFNNLGLMHNRDDLPTAARYFERAIEVIRRRPGPLEPLIAATYHNLGNLLIEQEDLKGARVHYQQSVDQFSSLLGASHPLIAHPLAGLGDISLRSGRPDEAIPTYLRALGLMEGAYGTRHPYLTIVLSGLGRAQQLVGRTEEARQSFSRAVEIAEGNALRSVEVAASLEGLAELSLQGSAALEARALFVRAADMFDETAGRDSAKGALAALRAGELAVQMGDHDAAVTWFERVLAKKTGHKGQDTSGGAAALELALALSVRPNGADRACTLADEARARLPVDHARRSEAEALVARICTKG